ncbi:MAG: roadblock/LC7 domain-containing protein [Candidatus Lokiarchaeota archaeon]|nr:roadblock/LC7 domain-containing protein [Candidatus Lokiarchaeota archaeon]
MSSDKSGGLASLLEEFKDTTGIQASAIVSRKDGLVMASSLAKGIDEDTVAANAARILFLGEETSKDLSIGGLTQILLKYNGGQVALAGAGKYAAVMAIVEKDLGIESGAVLFSIQSLAKKVEKILEG